MAPSLGLVGAVLLFAMLSPLLAHAQTRTVCPLGCAYTSISDAMVGLSEGTIIAVSAGNYTETAQPAPLVSFGLISVSGIVRVSCDSCEFAWLTLGQAGTNLTLNGSFVFEHRRVEVRNAAKLIQYGDLTLVSTKANAIAFLIQDGGIFEQQGNLTIHSLATGAVGVQLDGMWNQYGPVWMYTRQGNGAHLGTGSIWEQHHTCTLRVLAQSGGYGLSVSAGGTWLQYSLTSIHIEPGSSSKGVSIRGTVNVTGGLDVRAGYQSIGLQVMTLGTLNLMSATTMVVEEASTGFDVFGTLNQYEPLTIITRSGQGVYLYNDGLWNQDGELHLSVNSLPDKPSTGVIIADEGRWMQNKAANITVPGSHATGVMFADSAVLGAWTQNALVNLSISGDQACGIHLSDQGYASWDRESSLNVLRVTGVNASDICPAPFVPSLPYLQAQFNLTSPMLTLSPPGAPSSSKQSAVGYQFLSLDEIDPAGEVVQRFDLQQVGWQALNTSSNGMITTNSSTTLLFSTTWGDNATTVTYSFNTFPTETSIVLGNGQTIKLNSQYVKFTLGLSSWPWLSSENRLQLRIRVDRSFASHERQNNVPEVDITSLRLRSSDAGEANPLLRLLSYGLTRSTSQRVNCTFGVVQPDSMVTVTFDHFGDDTAIDYDPDLSLVLGAVRGGGDDNEALIIAVSVAIPVAVVLVLLVITGAVIVAWIQHRRRSNRDMVNFDDEEAKVDENSL